MEVLKDASATAIYGARGANGVVIITTKEGEVGETRVNANISYGLQTVPNKIDLLNGAQFQQLANEIDPDAFPLTDQVPNTDWQDLVFDEPAGLLDANLSVSGGSEKVNYYVAAGYFNQQGVIPSSDYERITFRLNNTYNLTENFRLGHNLSVARSVQNLEPGGIINATYRARPDVNPYTPEGDFAEVPSLSNPLATIAYNNEEVLAFQGVGNVFAEVTFAENFTFTSSEETFSNIWSALFQGVRRANAVVENVPAIEMDETLKNRLLAEARFLRAAFYFELARSYGDLPKVLTADPERQLPRSPVAEIYNEIIIPDLQFAADNLPLRSEYDDAQLGRATRGAAQGLLAKVYLYREDYANAQALAEAVINSDEYALPDDFAEEFSPTTAFGPGTLFEIGALRDDFGNGGNQYGQTQGVRGTVLVGGEGLSKGWGFGRPTLDIINFYQEDDPRMDASVIFLGDTIYGEVVIGDEGTPDTTYIDEAQTQIAQLETYNQKVFMPGDDENPQWGYNRKVLRYADVLLIAAEAALENGNTALALQYLNQVHTRAMGEPVTETDPAALRQLIYDERRAELAFEGERFYDLVRTGRAAEVLGPLGFQAGKHELFPIPQSEIDITEGSVDQNPGY